MVRTDNLGIVKSQMNWYCEKPALTQNCTEKKTNSYGLMLKSEEKKDVVCNIGTVSFSTSPILLTVGGVVALW